MAAVLTLQFDCEIWSEDRDFFGTGVAWVELIRYRDIAVAGRYATWLSDTRC